MTELGYALSCEEHGPRVHPIGPDQDGFLRFYEREVLPRFD
jgi:hypothetical protein